MEKKWQGSNKIIFNLMFPLINGKKLQLKNRISLGLKKKIKCTLYDDPVEMENQLLC